MQSGELLVDMMKLQNIFNFELHKMLKQFLPDHVLVQDGKSPSIGADNVSSAMNTKRDVPADIQVTPMAATNINLVSLREKHMPTDAAPLSTADECVSDKIPGTMSDTSLAALPMRDTGNSP